MKRLLLTALLPLAGCAMTPQEQDRFRENFFMGMGAGAAVRQQPVYQQPPTPMRMPTTTTCRRSPWDGSVTCDSW